MNYNLYINNELVGTGLSKGELNQWLLDLNRELDYFGSLEFTDSLGWQGEGAFADYLYDNELELPITLAHKKDTVVIMEDEF